MTRRIFFLSSLFLVLCTRLYAQEVFPFLGEITTDNINIRAGQDVSFEKLGELTKGEEVVVVAKSYDWYKIKLPNHAQCYVSENYVKMRFDDIGVITGNRVNVRAGVNDKSNIIGRLAQDTKIKVRNHFPGWFQIEPMEGIYGWVADKFITFKSKEIPAPYVIVEPSRNIYKRSAVLEEEPKKEEPPAFLATGQIEDLGRFFPAKDIRYKLTVDDKTVYYLQGSKESLDQFIHKSVKVEGSIQPDPNKFYKYPVIAIIKIDVVQ